MRALVVLGQTLDVVGDHVFLVGGDDHDRDGGTGGADDLRAVAHCLAVLVIVDAQQRKRGFIKAIEEKGLRLVASEPADWETEKAAEVFQAMWMRYPDLKAVYCSNDAMALGVLQQMQEKNCYLPVVGFDNDAVMKEFLSTGKLVATADIFSSQMAVRGIEFALDVLEGKIENRGVHSTAYEIIKQ